MGVRSRALALLQGSAVARFMLNGCQGVHSSHHTFSGGLGTTLLPAMQRSSTPCSHLATLAAPTAARRVGLLTNLKQLSKFRLSALVVLTASSGFVMGSGESLDWQGLFWTSLGTFGAAACANTLNQIYEVANDRCMTRTCNRPLPAGRFSRMQALGFAIAAGALGLGTLHYQTNEVTTALGAANILLYAGIYTPLKQISIANTWVGAVVGAIPPLMGWSSATGGQLDAGAWVLAAALFFWQLPHFLALAWLCKDDYIRGGFRMISAADRFGKRTAAAALRNAVYLLPLGLLAYHTDITTQPFAWEAAALAGMMLLPAVKFYQRPSQQSARKLFKSSLLYLPLTLTAMAVHRQPHTQQQQAGLTLGEWEAALQRAEEYLTPSGPLVPHLRASVERSMLAVARVLGFADGMGLRCPSTVHSDDGRRGGAQEQDTAPGLAGAGLGSGDASRVWADKEGVALVAAPVVTEQRQTAGTVQAQGCTTPACKSWRQGLDL